MNNNPSLAPEIAHPEMYQLCDDIINEHSADKDMTVRLNYVTSGKNECWLLTQKNSDANNTDGIVGIALTRAQVVDIVGALRAQL